MDLLDLADRIWSGERTTAAHHPFSNPTGELAEVRDGVAFVSSFANVSAFDTTDGLVLVDTGSFLLCGAVREQIREWTDSALHTAIYTHGHVDHVFGVPLYEREANDHGLPAPRVVAHELVPRRFDRYRRTAGYNARINRRQFQLNVEWPTQYRYPDLTYRDELVLEIGEDRFELHHARGETDDHTWTWVPTRRVLCCGDLFTWTLPNAGNPQKAQRYPDEWAQALREMAKLDAEVMLPGHGLPVVGVQRVREALSDTAELLESLIEQTLELMNEGAALEEIVETVRVPAELVQKPYLRPVYDEPEFIVRNIWRLYGGWWDLDPAHLKPAPVTQFADEIAELCGGVQPLAERASELANAGELRLATDLIELAARAAPDDASVQEMRARILELRAERESSTMAKGVYATAAREARERADAHAPEPAARVS